MTIPRSGIVTLFPRPLRRPQEAVSVMERYLALCRVRNLAENTVATYTRHLSGLLGFLEQNDVLLLPNVSLTHLNRYLQWLADGEGNSPRTIAAKQNVVRELFRFAEHEGLVDENPAAEWKAVQFTPADVIAPPVEALKRMIDAIPTGTTEGLRDRAFFRVMLDTALRPSSILLLDIHDPNAVQRNTLDPQTGAVRTWVKGGRTEPNQVGEETLEYLAAWMAVRDRFARYTSPSAIFLSRLGERPTNSNMLQRLKCHAERAGLPKSLNQRMIRHARAGQILDQVGINAAQRKLGHRSRDTTAKVYGTWDKRKALEIVEQQCPL